MSMDDDSGDSIAWTLTAIGGGAFLLWLFLRRRGKGWGGNGSGSGCKDGGGGVPADPHRVCIGIYDEDRILVEGTPADLATAIAAARAVGYARVRIRGDARHGAAEDLIGALARAGVDIVVDPGFEERADATGAHPADPAKENKTDSQRECAFPPYDKVPSRLLERLKKASP